MGQLNGSQHLKGEVPRSRVITNLLFLPAWQLLASSSDVRGAQPWLRGCCRASSLPGSPDGNLPANSGLCRPRQREQACRTSPRPSPVLPLRWALPAETGQQGYSWSSLALAKILESFLYSQVAPSMLQTHPSFPCPCRRIQEVDSNSFFQRGPTRVALGASGCHTEWKPGASSQGQMRHTCE